MHIDLMDESQFTANAFWPVFAWLRANDPVHWHADRDGSGFWVLSRYADIAAAYGDAELFSSRFGMNLGSDAAAVAAVSQRMLIVSDPPVHTYLKRVLNRPFGADRAPALTALVQQVVDDVLDEAAAAADGPFDFVAVATAVPNRVICALMGLDRGEWAQTGALVTDAFENPDPDVRAAAHAEIFLLFSDLIARRRSQPGDDFISEIATTPRATGTRGQERPLTDEEIVFNCSGVLAGGNETTRYAAAGGMAALIDDPSQWELLRDGEELIPTAVEEILRWTVPGVHALRVATRATTIRDVPIRAGDRVSLWNVSANRDEAVFAEPDRFRVDRSPNRHLTFGTGRHLCLGARLARLELTALLAGLVRRFSTVRAGGERVYNASNFTWGLRSLPVVMTPARAQAGSRG